MLPHSYNTTCFLEYENTAKPWNFISLKLFAKHLLCNTQVQIKKTEP